MGILGFLDTFRRDSAQVTALRSELELQARFDDFFSNEMGFGTSDDKSFADWDYGARTRLSWTKLDAMYRSHGLYRKIINHPANEATREWIDINHPRGQDIQEALEDLDIPCLSTKALRWSRNYRGAALILDVNDGLKPDMPVNELAIRDVRVRQLLDARYVTPAEPHQFKRPEWYFVTTDQAETIHESRLLLFFGEDAGLDNRAASDHWGESWGDVIYRPFMNYSTDYSAGSTFVKDFNQGVLKVPDLANQIKKGGMKAAVAIARTRRRLASLVHAMLIDKEEEWQYVARNAQGMAEMVKLARDYLCTCTGWPHSELFGEAPGASLGEAGSYQSRSFYNMVRQLQKEHLAQPLRRIIRYVALAKDIKDPVPFTFNSLWQLTPKEKADLRKLGAETDKIDIDNRVLDAEEARKSHYDMGQYSQEIRLIEGKTPWEKPEPPEPPQLPPQPPGLPPAPKDAEYNFDYNPYAA